MRTALLAALAGSRGTSRDLAGQLLASFVDHRWYILLVLLLAAFVVLIVVGSVHLAWHYAIDAYVALVATWLIWWASGCFLRSSAARFGQPAGASRVLSSIARAAGRP